MTRTAIGHLPALAPLTARLIAFLIASLIASLAASLVAPSTAHAAEALTVATEGCGDLRADEIQRVLGIELAHVTDTWGGPEPLRVELSCEGSRVHVVAIDPVTDKHLSRDVSLGRTRDRDRTVALLVSQLFLTSWSELLLTPPPEAPPRPPIVPGIAPQLARAAETLTRQAIAPSSTRLSVAVLGGPRVRSLSAPIVGVRAALRPVLLLGAHGSLALELGYERGAADRASGAVGYTVASGEIGGALRTSPIGPAVFEIGARGGIAYLDAHGDATAPAVGSSASGAVAEVSVGAGPTFSIGAGRVGLELGAGLTAPRATARVARDADVALGGAWLGVSLLLGVAEGR